MQIRKLGEPVESLQEGFLQSMKARLEGILVEAHRVVESIAAHYRLSPPPGSSPPCMTAAQQYMDRKCFVLFFD